MDKNFAWTFHSCSLNILIAITWRLQSPSWTPHNYWNCCVMGTLGKLPCSCFRKALPEKPKLTFPYFPQSYLWFMEGYATQVQVTENDSQSCAHMGFAPFYLADCQYKCGRLDQEKAESNRPHLHPGTLCWKCPVSFQFWIKGNLCSLLEVFR